MTAKHHLQMGNIQISKCSLQYMQVQKEKKKRDFYLDNTTQTNHGNFAIFDRLLLHPYKQFRPNILKFR